MNEQINVAIMFVIDAARMVLADHDVLADPTKSLETLRQALDQYDRVTDD